jgi:small subunit ribosomal protein S1
VCQLNREAGKVVVSHRRALVDSQMESMSRGDVVSGIVKLLKPYGAFVEVNGMSGLLHISQVSYDRVEDLSLIFQPGQRIKCMIVDHDKVRLIGWNASGRSWLTVCHSSCPSGERPHRAQHQDP